MTPLAPIEVVPLTADETLADAVAARPGARPSFNRTLRVALAMRGGVSLAVWIGGAVAEFDLLRRTRLYEHEGRTIAFLLCPSREAPSEPTLRRAAEYAALLDAARFDRVEADLLAGASAGGLNAVVYAAAQRAGASPDRLLGVWSEVGGFWDLLERPGRARLDALMRGDDYFTERTLDALHAFYRTADTHPSLRADYTGVDLSATVIDGHDESEQAAWEGRGHFRFIGSAEHSLGNAVPSRHDPHYPGKTADDLENLRRLALAARSTSSLPGGFPPAGIVSTEGAGGTGADAGSGAPAEMRFVFAGHRADRAEPYRVVDGAVFDNVPIDRALRSARTRASDRHAERAMLFLDPDPDRPIGQGSGWDPNAGRFFAAIRAMASRMLRQETVSAEVLEVQRFNAERLVAAARRDASGPVVADAAWSDAARAARRGAYVRAMGSVVADHLAEAVSLPSTWQLTSRLAARRRIAPIDRRALAGLAPRAVRAFDAAARDDAAVEGRGVLALADAANCVLGWARALEGLAEEPGGRRLPEYREVRRTAYAVLGEAVGAIDLLTDRVLARSAEAALEGRAVDREDFDAWLAVWREASATIDTASSWERLDACVATLAAATRDGAARIGDYPEADRLAWADSPWTRLGDVAGLRADDLPPLFCASGIPPAVSHVRYWSIGTDERAARPADFAVLADDDRRDRLQRALRAGTPPAVAAAELASAEREPRLTPKTKLAGYGFGNFLGFLSRDWRINDWWWGRLDGAAGAARFLASAAADGPDADEAVERLQTALLDEADADAELGPLEPDVAAAPGAPAPGRSSRARLRAGADGIANLRPGYRVGIASRALRLLGRALRPSGWGGRIAAGIAAAVARPALVGLPAAVDPPRLALITGFAGGAFWLTSWTVAPATTPVRPVLAAVFSGAVLVALVIMLARAAARRRAIAAALDAAGETRLAEHARTAARRALPTTVQYAVFAAVSALPLAIAILDRNLLMFLLCAGTSAVLLFVVRQLARSAPARRIPGRRPRAVLMVGAFALLGAVLPTVQFFAAEEGGILAPGREWTLPILAASAAASTVALTIDWLPLRGVLRHGLRATRGVSWLAITIVSVGLAWLVAWLVGLVDGFLAQGWRDALEAGAFILVWANLLWFGTEVPRERFGEIDDRVVRAPLP